MKTNKSVDGCNGPSPNPPGYAKKIDSDFCQARGGMDKLVSIEEPIALGSMSVGATRPSRAIMKKVLSAVHRFKLIKPGDRIALGCSGGKDSL